MGQEVVTTLVIDSETAGADRFSQSMDKASASAQQGVNSAAGLTLAIAGVGVAFVGALVGLRSFFDYVGQQNKQLIDIAENARNAGMSAREFQETLFAARSKGLSEKDFVSGLDKITTSLTEASSGVTKFGRLFEANELSIKNQNGELKNSKQALADIAGLMQGATPVIQQGIAKIVGLSKDWIPFLRDGIEAIEKQKKAAADLGIVIGDDVIAKAKEFDAQWKTAIATWDLQFKASLAGIMPLLVKMATLASTIIEGVGSVNSSVSRWMTPDEDKSKAQLNDQINEVARLRDMMESLAQTGGELKKLKVTNLAELVGLGGDATIKDVYALLDKLSALYDKAPTKLTVNAPGSTVLPPNENKDALDRETERLEKHIAVTKADTEAVGQSAAAQAGLRAEATLYAAAERAGFTDLEKFAEKFMKIREEVEATTQALNKAKIGADIKLGRDTAFLSSEDLQIAMKLKDTFNNDIPAALASSEAAELRFNSQLKQMNDIARSSATQFTDNLIKGLASGQTAVESLHNAFKNLASSLTSGALKSLFQGDFLMAGIQGLAAIGAAIFSANTSSSGDKWLAQQTEGMNSRLGDISQRSSLVGVDTNTRQGAILAQDAEFVRQRIAENKAGGQAMNALLQLQVQERNQLMTDWDKKDTDLLKANADAKLAIEKAAADRSLGFQNRLFAAANDNATLDGQLAAFDRAAQQERLTEVQNGGQAIVDLEAAQAAERLGVIQKYNDQITQSAKQAAQAQLDALNGRAKSVVDYLNNLVSGAGSTSSPVDTYTSAKSIFNADLALAIGGNPDAEAKFPQLADNFEKASRALNASSEAYQIDKSQIISQGLALPAVQNATDPVVIEMRNVLAAINAGNAAQALDATLQGVIKSAIDAGNASAVASALLAGGKIPADGLNFSQFVQGLGPQYANIVTIGTTLSTQDQIARDRLLNVFNELDGNGNGILEKSEAIKAASQSTLTQVTGTEQSTNQMRGNTATAVNQNNDSNTLLNAIVSLQNTATTQLTLLTAALSPVGVSVSVTSVGSTPGGGAGSVIVLNNQVVTALNKIVWNTAVIAQNTEYKADGSLAHGHAGGGVYAKGGWITGGVPGLDSVHILAQRDEYMINANATRALTQQFGAGVMDIINSGRLPFNDNGRPLNVVAPVFRGGGGGGDNAALITALMKRIDQLETTLSKATIISGNQVVRAITDKGDEQIEATDENGKRVSFAITQAAKDNKAA